MTSKEFFEQQSTTDANSVINKHEETYNRFDLIRFAQAYHDSEVKKLNTPDVSGSDLVKSDWDLRECFNQLRFDKNHHSGLGDIRLTIAQQEEICDLVERFYHCR